MPFRLVGVLDVTELILLFQMFLLFFGLNVDRINLH